MDILEAMTVRRSVRTYTGRPITALQSERIVAAISDAANPFGPAPYIKLISFGEERDLRPSTYGMIRGACDYLTMGYGGSEADALAAGFAMEQVVLEATRMGLGTCWIAATFRGSDFERKATWQPVRALWSAWPAWPPEATGASRWTAYFSRPDSQARSAGILLSTKRWP